MSEDGIEPEGFEAEDLELQRRLDAAFSETRPGGGFEDQLWTRLDAGLQRRRRERFPLVGWVPRGAWPALGALAAVLVLLVGVLPLLVRGHSGASSASTQASALPAARSLAPKAASGGSTSLAPSPAFGALPTPTLANQDQGPVTAGAVPYYGPAALAVTVGIGSLPFTLPVFRFTEPTTQQAAEMARAYNAQPVTTQSQPFREPRIQLTVAKTGSGSGSPLPDAAAVAATDAFLFSKKLSWAWSPVREVVDQGPVALVHYVRQFDVVGYGRVAQVDQLGAPAGADLAVRSDAKVFQATVPLMLNLRPSAYPARAAQRAAQDALNLPPPSPVGLTPLPQVQLSQADLVYVAIAAGAYGYFEPAVLFRGAFTFGGTQYEKRVLVPALDASQLR